MSISQYDRLLRALKYAIAEKEAEEKSMAALENLKAPREIIILRNKKTLYMAEVDQIIRNIETEMKELEVGA